MPNISLLGKAPPSALPATPPTPTDKPFPHSSTLQPRAALLASILTAGLQVRTRSRDKHHVLPGRQKAAHRHGPSRSDE